MLRSKHLVGLILVATLMATLIPSLTAVYAEGQDNQQKKAEALVEAAVAAKEEVYELMNTTDEVPTDVEILYEEGVGNLTAAQEALNSTDYGLAISLARDAMSIFREVYKQLDSDPKVQSEMDDQNKGLIEAMNRALARIDKINGTVLGFEHNDTINEILLRAQDYLDVEEAKDWLDLGRVNETAWNLTQANKLIGLAHSMLKKGGQELKVKRIESYLKVIWNLCNKTDRLVGKAVEKELLPADDPLVKDLGTVKTLIKDAEEAFKLEDYSEAVAKLVDARNMLKGIERELLELRRAGSEGE